jgi:hypothetical protein
MKLILTHVVVVGLRDFGLGLFYSLPAVQNEDDDDADEYDADDEADDYQDKLPIDWNQR